MNLFTPTTRSSLWESFGKMKLLALCGLFFLFMGTQGMAQTTKAPVICPTTINNLPAQPYLAYGNHQMIRDCRQEWIKDNPVACQTYLQNLRVGLKYIDVSTLSTECQSTYYYRMKEMKRVKREAESL